MEEVPNNQNKEKGSPEYQSLDGAFAYLRDNENAMGIESAYLAFLKGVEHGLDVSRYRAEFPDLAKAARANEVKSVLWQFEYDIEQLEQQDEGAEQFIRGESYVIAALQSAAEIGVDTTECEKRFLELQGRIEKLKIRGNTSSRS